MNSVEFGLFAFRNVFVESSVSQVIISLFLEVYGILTGANGFFQNSTGANATVAPNVTEPLLVIVNKGPSFEQWVIGFFFLVLRLVFLTRIFL